MNERWFKDFGECLDTLEHIMKNSDDDVEKAMKEHFDALNRLYYDIKKENGFKDASDEVVV